MKPDKKYLKKLLNDAIKIFHTFECTSLEFPLAEISYVATKKRNHMGIGLGIDAIAEMKKYNIKKSAKIRSTCNYYNKFFEIDGKVVKIEMYVGGHDRIDYSYIAHYDGEYRYLFPYRDNAKSIYSGPIIVTHFQKEKVTEEYFVEQSQIVYNNYDYAADGKIYNYYINYVPDGSYPVLAESEGYFVPDTLEYAQENSSVWYQNRP